MMNINFEKGWLPERLRTNSNLFVKEMTKPEYALHILSRVKWSNLGLILLLIVGFGYGIYKMTIDLSGALPELQEKNRASYVKAELAKYEQVEVVIREGDTAWSIQNRLTPNENDLRHPLYLAEEINGEMKWGVLIPGQRYIFLKSK